MLYPVWAEANRVVDDIVMSGSDGTVFHRLTHDKEIIPGIAERMSIDYSLSSEGKEHSKPSVWHDTDGQKPAVQTEFPLHLQARRAAGQWWGKQVHKGRYNHWDK